MFYRLECQFRKKLNIKCKEFQFILQIIAMEINDKYDLPAIGNKNYALQKPFKTDFLTVIGTAKHRPSFVICLVAQGCRPRCGPRHPILHSNIFLYVKLFATIILSWSSLKCILWYSLEWSDPLIKNKNSVMPMLIEKNWTKNVLLSLENEVFFLKKVNPIFSIKLGQRLPKSFSQLHVKNSKFFLSFFKKKNIGLMCMPVQYCRLSPTAPFYLWLVYGNKGIKQLRILRYTILNLICNYHYYFSVTFATKI